MAAEFRCGSESVMAHPVTSARVHVSIFNLLCSFASSSEMKSGCLDEAKQGDGISP